MRKFIHILPENKAMLRVFRKSGLPMTLEFKSANALEIDITLAGQVWTIPHRFRAFTA
jgi:hypothetical protein